MKVVTFVRSLSNEVARRFFSKILFPLLAIAFIMAKLCTRLHRSLKGLSQLVGRAKFA
jgi:hypothetical protein